MDKNGRKMYNFDDLAEFGDVVAETHMVDDQPIGTSHDVLKGDDFMQDSTHEDAHDNRVGARFSDLSSIMTMQQNMQLRQDNNYEEDRRRRDSFEVAQVEIFRLMQ